MRPRTHVPGVAARVVAIAAAIALPPSAGAQEVFVGVLAHGVDTPFTFDTFEGGADLQFGYRFDIGDALAPIGRPQPYAFASVNTAGDTDFVAAGLAWRIGVADRGRLYVRPGVGLALHDAPGFRVGPNGFRTDLGSRVLFEPELGAGYQVTRRLSVEYQWTHISNARLLNRRQNPGIDMMGVRVNYGL